MQGKNPIIFHIMRGSGPCRAIWMTAEALNVPYEIKDVDLFAGGTKTPEYLKMNPFHTVPTMDDNGFILWESRAIMTYLANKVGDDNLYPKDFQKRAVIDSRLDFDIGKLYPTIKEWGYPQVFKKEAPNQERLNELNEAVAGLELLLGLNKFVAGDHLTLADLSIFCTLSFVEILNFDFSKFPKVNAWSAGIRKLPYFSKTNKAFEEWKGSFKK